MFTQLQQSLMLGMTVTPALELCVLSCSVFLSCPHEQEQEDNILYKIALLQRMLRDSPRLRRTPHCSVFETAPHNLFVEAESSAELCVNR